MKAYRRLFLADGDSFVYQALRGIEGLKEGDKVQVFVSTEGLRRRLALKGYVRPNVWVIMAQPGPEAVDNRIKGCLGSQMGRKDRGQIFIISRDHGYYKRINRYRARYGIPQEDLD